MLVRGRRRAASESRRELKSIAREVRATFVALLVAMAVAGALALASSLLLVRVLHEDHEQLQPLLTANQALLTTVIDAETGVRGFLISENDQFLEPYLQARAAMPEVLAEARDLAHRCGAAGLEHRLHEELVVAGARPRRVAVHGVESLTAAERRVAELAAQGLRNREIAEALFVTLKTVEVHLRRVYSKLDIERRSQLPQALGLGG